MAEVEVSRSGSTLTQPRLPKPGDVLCIIPGPSKELKREPAGDKWCFGCRLRLPHDWVLWADEGPSYYDPEWHIECTRCGQDRTRFG